MVRQRLTKWEQDDDDMTIQTKNREKNLFRPVRRQYSAKQSTLLLLSKVGMLTSNEPFSILYEEQVHHHSTIIFFLKGIVEVRRG